MAIKKVIVDYAGNLSEITATDYINPGSLGSGSFSINSVLNGNNQWVSIASLNYWTKIGVNLYYTDGDINTKNIDADGYIAAYTNTGESNQIIVGSNNSNYAFRNYNTNPRLDILDGYANIKLASFYRNGSVVIGTGVDNGFAKLQVNGSIQQTVTTAMLKADPNGVLVAAIDGSDYYSPNTISNANYWTKTVNDLSYSLGNVGIGVVNATNKLEVVTGSSGAYFTRNVGDVGTGAVAFGIATATTTTRLYSYSDALQFHLAAIGGTAVNRMTILENGNVGIGVTSPLTLLHLSGGSIRINGGSVDGSTSSIQLGTNWANLYYDSSTSGDNNRGLIFRENLSATRGFNFKGFGGIDLVRISGNGNVGIGTINPTLAKLQIIKNGTYNVENTSGLAILSADAAGAAELVLGADATNSITYIQAISRSTTYNYTLALNAQGGNVLIGGITSAGGYKLQVTGSIYGSTLTGADTLLKTVGGVITRASASDITDLLGTGNYIINGTSLQSANFNISGSGTVINSLRLGANIDYGLLTTTKVATGIVSHIVLNSNSTATDDGVAIDFNGSTVWLGNTAPSARIAMAREGGAAGGYITFSTRLINTSDLFERIRITSNGNVGIGTITPTWKLHVLDKSGGAGILLANQDTADTNNAFRIQFKAYTGSNYMNGILGASTATINTLQYGGGTGLGEATNQHIFYTSVVIGVHNSGSTRMLITNNGDIRNYGTTTGTSATPYFSFWDSASARLGYIGYGSNSNNHLYLRNEGAGGDIHFHTSSIQRAYITSTGKFIIGTSSSDNGFGLFQVQGDINQTSVLNSVLKADLNGTLVAATGADVATLLGTSASGSYIQNQFSAVQIGELRITGRIAAGREGYYGTYVSAEVQGVWSIGKDYKIDTTLNNFGSQYGIVYGHTNAGSALPTGTTKLPITGWGHQILYTTSGNVTSGVSLTLGQTWQLAGAYYGNYSNTLYGSSSYSFIHPGAASYLANNLTLGKTGTGGILRFIRPTDGANAGAIGFIDNSTINITSFGGSGVISFTTSTTEKARITTIGQFLIGTTSAFDTHKLQVDSGSISGNGIYVRGNIYATGNIVADGYFSGTQSDISYKSNFKQVKVIDVIDNIQVQSYNHSAYNNARMIGSVAQELQKYFPELISKDGNNKLRVDNYGYSALALQLGKELKSEVDILRERVKELEKQVEQLSK